jgi:hypothetical protein
MILLNRQSSVTMYGVWSCALINSIGSFLPPILEVLGRKYNIERVYLQSIGLLLALVICTSSAYLSLRQLFHEIRGTSGRAQRSTRTLFLHSTYFAIAAAQGLTFLGISIIKIVLTQIHGDWLLVSRSLGRHSAC